MKSFNNFLTLTRDELRKTLGGARDCSDLCTSDSQCRGNNPNGYCGTFACRPRPGGGEVRIKVCTLNDPNPTP